MTPERVKEAIEWGRSQDKVAPYPLRAFPAGFIGQKRTGTVEDSLLRIGYYTTPFLRVGLAAHQARTRGKSISADKISAEFLSPEIHVIAFPPATAASRATVESILVNSMVAKGLEGASKPGRFRSLRKESKEIRRLYEPLSPRDGLIASFPLSLLTLANVVHVTFDAPICMDVLDPLVPSRDCVWPFGQLEKDGRWGVKADGELRPIR